MSSRNSASSSQTPAAPKWRRWLGTFWGQLLFAVVVIGLVLSFVAKPYEVPSASMEQTLRPGDRILVNRLVYRFAKPKAGDVVVFNAGRAWPDTSGSTEGSSAKGAIKTVLGWTGFGPTGSHTLVKRVIATGRQKASCCSASGSVMVDGQALDELYLGSNFPFTPGKLDCTTTPRSLRCFGQVTVPEGSYLMLGDNRADSSDSAYLCRSASATPVNQGCWRFAEQKDIVGKAEFALWPFDRLAKVR